MNLVSLNSIIESAKHNKNTILKVANILNIKYTTLSTTPKYKYYTIEQKEQIISFINEHSPMETYFNKLDIQSKFDNVKTLTDFRKLVDWDRSRVLICMKYLQINEVGKKGLTKFYSDDDYLKYKFFIEQKLHQLNNLQNTYTKMQICKKLDINYEKFDTLCKHNNILPVFDWEFGKDSKYYSEESLNKLNDLISTSKKESKTRYTINELAEIFNKCDKTIQHIIQKLNIPYFKSITREYLIDDKGYLILEDYFSKTEISGSSYFEKEILEFVKSIYFDEIIENCRTVIAPKELDIYVPSKKVAIECDGLYWHSTEQLISKGKFNLSSDEKKYYKNKQLNKTLACEEKGIRLIHIFEDEWNDKKEICKSIISSALGVYKQKIFARKCEVRELSWELWKNFLHENHIQDYTFAKYRLGLFYNNELVQGIGIINSNHKQNEIELNRMVTKLNTQIIGGFSKLMKHSILLWNFTEIYSYISRRLFDGKGYYSSNFTIVKINEPTYFYVKRKSRYPRYMFMKNKIKNKYEIGELSYWNENETEEINMYKNQFGRLYDCGTIKVVYNS